MAQSLDDISVQYGASLIRRKERRPYRRWLLGGAIVTALMIALGIYFFRPAADKGNEVIPASTPEPTAAGSLVIPESAKSDIEAALRREDSIAALPKPKPKDPVTQLQLQNSAYKVGLLGGISDLAITLTNGSPFLLDKVVVEVSYLKPNGEVAHADQHEFLAVPAGGSQQLTVPKSKRGVQVSYRVVEVVSQAYHQALSET
jgi:hypothetical protein